MVICLYKITIKKKKWKQIEKERKKRMQDRVLENAQSNSAHIKILRYTIMDIYGTTCMVWFTSTLEDQKKHNYQWYGIKTIYHSTCKNMFCMVHKSWKKWVGSRTGTMLISIKYSNHYATTLKLRAVDGMIVV